MDEGTGGRIALLIDADNAPAAKLDVVLTEVARHGTATVRRAYGDWKNPHLASWEAVLHSYAIRPVQQFAYTKGKNASDIAMVIDAMDLLHDGRLDGFALYSSDGDFTPLVMRLLTDGMRVYGFGQAKTPEPFVNACSQFTYVEALDDEAEAPQPRRAVPTAELRQNTRLVRMLRGAVAAAASEEDWAHLAGVGQQIRNQASFDARNYGYRKLLDLIEATGLFEVRRTGSGAVLVRDAQARR